MTIKDIMARSDLSAYAEIALILFLLAFLLILWRVYSPSRRAEFRHLAELPLEDEPTTATRTGSN